MSVYMQLQFNYTKIVLFIIMFELNSKACILEVIEYVARNIDISKHAKVLRDITCTLREVNILGTPYDVIFKIPYTLFTLGQKC